MASSGTVGWTPGTPGIVNRWRLQPGKEGVAVLVVTRMKSTMQLDAADLTLRTIRGVQATLYHEGAVAGGGVFLQGSVNTSGSLMNAAHFRTLRGSIKGMSAPGGTQHVGIIAAGTQKISALIFGA